jgi:hypothetical protein
MHDDVIKNKRNKNAKEKNMKMQENVKMHAKK